MSNFKQSVKRLIATSAVKLGFISNHHATQDKILHYIETKKNSGVKCSAQSELDKLAEILTNLQMYFKDMNGAKKPRLSPSETEEEFERSQDF